MALDKQSFTSVLTKVFRENGMGGLLSKDAAEKLFLLTNIIAFIARNGGGNCYVLGVIIRELEGGIKAVVNLIIGLPYNCSRNDFATL